MASYVETYYSRTLAAGSEYPRLGGFRSAEVCVVGGGLAGLTAAIELARGGRSVVLLEANRVAWGASGRNGGFVSPGYAARQAQILRRVGPDHAKTLYRLSMEGVEIVADNIRQLRIADANPIPGILRAVRTDQSAALQAFRDEQQQEFGRTLRYLSRDEVGQLLVSTKYYGALLDENSFHFHPLNYAQGLAHEIVRLGGQVYEGSAVSDVELQRTPKRLRTAAGEIEAQTVVFAGGGYTDRILPALRRAYLPIATYMMLTDSARPLIAEAIRTRAAVSDGRRAGDYYRLVDGGERILWGGRITTRRTDPRDIAALLRKDMISTYPQLGGLKTEIAWSGLMSYARHLMPQIGRLSPDIWYCTGFGGHGMNTTAIGGRVVAEGIQDKNDRYRLFAPFSLAWNGGPFGVAAAQLTYWSYRGLDRYSEWNAAHRMLPA
jgi:gamma-glutamylputrescine oxidase